MYVTFNCSHNDLAVRFNTTIFFLFYKRHKVPDRFFHYACRLNDLRQKHFSGTEQIADNVHTIHKRSFNDIEWTIRGKSRFLGIIDHKFIDTIDECVRQAFIDWQFTPVQIFDDIFWIGFLSLVLLCHLQ